MYHRLNAGLRDHDYVELVPYLPFMKLLLTALYKLPLIKARVYRGVKLNLSEVHVITCRMRISVYLKMILEDNVKLILWYRLTTPWRANRSAGGASVQPPSIWTCFGFTNRCVGCRCVVQRVVRTYAYEHSQLSCFPF